MTAPRLISPYTPETLAERWGVSATSIRNRCRAGEIAHFRLGKLYRIPAHVVEEIEQCQTLPSDDYAAASAFPGTKTGSDDAISLRHAREKTQSGRR